MRTRSVLNHAGQAVLEGALIAIVVVGLIAGTAFAARGGGKPSGGGGSGGTISVSYMDGATQAYYGARVTFKVSTGATAYPYVHLKCSKGGAVVLDGYQG